MCLYAGMPHFLSASTAPASSTDTNVADLRIRLRVDLKLIGAVFVHAHISKLIASSISANTKSISRQVTLLDPDGPTTNER